MKIFHKMVVLWCIAPMVIAHDMKVLRRPTSTTPTIFKKKLPGIEAKSLYSDILNAAVPGIKDPFPHNLIGIKGDSGAEIGLVSREDTVSRIWDIVKNTQADNYTRNKESFVLRVEHLPSAQYNLTKSIISKAIPNNVLEDHGTIHIYVSRPNSSALPNHTDPTDIIVVQMSGAKEWLLCTEIDTFFPNTGHQNKFEKCSTYNQQEIGELSCNHETLFPGDVLYLPKRIVHSARATLEEPSAHITFAFSDESTKMVPRERVQIMSNKRILPAETCDRLDGGEQCTESCNLCPTSDWECFCSPGCGSNNPVHPCLPGVESLGFGFDMMTGEESNFRIVPLEVGAKTYAHPLLGTFTIPDNVRVKTLVENAHTSESRAYFNTFDYRRNFASSVAVGLPFHVPGLFAFNKRYVDIRAVSFRKRKIVLEKRYEKVYYRASLIGRIEDANITAEAVRVFEYDKGPERVEKLGTHVVSAIEGGGMATVRSFVEECALASSRITELSSGLSANFFRIAVTPGEMEFSLDSSCSILLDSKFQGRWIIGGDEKHLTGDNATNAERKFSNWAASIPNIPAVIKRDLVEISKVRSSMEEDVLSYSEQMIVEEEIDLDNDICQVLDCPAGYSIAILSIGASLSIMAFAIAVAIANVM